MATNDPSTYSVEIRSDLANTSVALHVRGEIDLVVADELSEAIVLAARSTGAAEVLVDLGMVSFLDSSGIAALIRAREQLDHPGGLRVVSASPLVQKALELTGTASLLEGPHQLVEPGGSPV